MSTDNSGASLSTPQDIAVDTGSEAAEEQNTEVAEEGQEEQQAEAAEAQPEEGKESKEAKKADKKEEKKALKKKLKLKVDGKELEEELDWDNEEDLVKKLQMAKVAQQRMQQYSQLEKDVQSFVDQLRKNPRKVLSDPRFGLDLKQLAAEVIEEEIANSQKTPEQIAKEKLEAELQTLKEEREREKEDFKKRELERLQQQEYERYDILMTKALETSDLPKSPYVVKKMADYMLMGLNNGIDVTPEDVLPLVREEMQNDLKEMFAAMPDEVIEAIVGKDVIGRIRKKSVAKAKQQPPQPLKSQVKETGQNASPKKEGAEKKINYKDFFGV